MTNQGQPQQIRVDTDILDTVDVNWKKIKIEHDGHVKIYAGISFKLILPQGASQKDSTGEEPAPPT